MDENVDAGEEITRFLVHSGEFKPGQKRVDYSAFMPDKKREKSVYRTNGLSAEQVRNLGHEFVESPNRLIKGEARVVASVIFNAGLNIEAAPEVHRRHANIRGYTGSPADRITARKIAEEASLVVY